MSATPGPWERDERGRRYRRAGDLIEYEMEIGGVPQSVFLESNRLMREQLKNQLKEEQREAERLRQLRRHCPFATGMQNDCIREKCALFLDGCALGATSAAKETEGLRCPLSARRTACRTDCALYKGGCALTGNKRVK